MVLAAVQTNQAAATHRGMAWTVSGLVPDPWWRIQSPLTCIARVAPGAELVFVACSAAIDVGERIESNL